LKHSGLLWVNGSIASPRDFLQPGDTITLEWKKTCTIEPENIPLSICYEDNYLLIIDKPSGMLVHPVGMERTTTVANAVLHYYRETNCDCGYHPVHRLDRNTSGLLLIAKEPHIQHLMSPNHIKAVRREYHAIATGVMDRDDGCIDVPIARCTDSIIQRRVDQNGQTAQTCFSVLKRLSGATLLELTLLTGRTHQIRVHLAHIGHPLVGDDLYGGSSELLPRQALHSAKMQFIHPITKQLLSIFCPLPADMQHVMEILR
jgi:23S rRNA pseudouridine1911/1915/1917 synthase